MSGRREHTPRIPKDLRKEARIARANGWVIERTRSDHIKWIPPSGPILITGSTPSDRRGILNHRASLRRQGLPV